MNDKPLNDEEAKFNIDPDILRQITEVIDREGLRKEVEGEADDWIATRAHELLNAYITDAYEWFARAIARYPEDEPITDRYRMFIWVVANRLNESAPLSMSKEAFYSWTFGLLAMGYVMRMDHETQSESNEHNDGNENGLRDANNRSMPENPQPET